MLKNVLLFLLIQSAFIYSQSFLKVDSLDKKIIDLTFNDNFKEVKSICDSLINLDPQNPKYYFHYFGADALQLHEQINSFPLSERDSLREILVDKSLEKLETALQTIDDSPQTNSSRFYIASLHGYYSRYAGLNGYWWAAYVNGTKANSMFEAIIESYPECYDAYLYPGVFGYYAARLNGFNGFIASILGVSGDRETGLKYIKIALRKGKMVYPQALLMMLEINTVMEDNPYNAIKYFKEFLSVYPANKRVANWYGHTLLNLNRTKEIKEKLETDSLKVFDDFVKAKFYFLSGIVDSTIKYSNMALSKSNTWKGIIEHTKYYYLYSQWLKGNSTGSGSRIELNKFYSNLFYLDVKNENESKYIYHLTTLLAEGKYNAFEIFSKGKPDFKEKYFAAEFDLLYGTMLFENGKFNEAIPYFKKAEETPDFRKRTIALRYLLDIYLQVKTPVEEIKTFIEKVEDTDFNKLIFRLDDLNEKYNL